MNNSFIPKIHDLTPFPRTFWVHIAPVFLLISLPLNSTAQQPVDLRSQVEQAKRSVVPLVCRGRDAITGQQRVKVRTLGTAFMVDASGVFMTANHVIADLRRAPWKDLCFPEVGFPVGGWKRESQNVRSFLFDINVCQVNVNFDVAVCKTNLDLTKAGFSDFTFDVLNISKERPADGTAVFFVGFPLQTDDPWTSIGAIAGFTASDGYNTIIIDKAAWPGASGSPIVLASSNAVVGMLVRTGAGDASGISFGVAGERLFDILTSAKANWSKAENKK